MVDKMYTPSIHGLYVICLTVMQNQCVSVMFYTTRDLNFDNHFFSKSKTAFSSAKMSRKAIVGRYHPTFDIIQLSCSISVREFLFASRTVACIFLW